MTLLSVWLLHRFVRVHHQDAHDAPPVGVPRRLRVSGVSVPALDLPSGPEQTGGKVAPVFVCLPDHPVNIKKKSLKILKKYSVQKFTFWRFLEPF